MTYGSYPNTRMRRTRKHSWLRDLLSENTLTSQDLIMPFFVQEGVRKRTAIDSMPDVFRLSIDELVKEAGKAFALCIPAIAIFPVVEIELKSENAEESYNPDNLICRAVKAVKNAFPNLGVICDVALDPYTLHGHDGILENSFVANDKTIEILCKQALTCAQAGCDIVAPSDMMDGRIGVIRKFLDKENFSEVSIISYSAKYASAFYGPFRHAVGSASNLGKADKRTYQMNPANSDEAIREVALDIAEGADIIMVKPAMPYLDIIRRVKDNFEIPIIAYQVSGEYSMLKLAAQNGELNYNAVILESLIACKRSGASAIFTYAAVEVAELLRKI
ncbi:MAG: porphobilinogen synthase [Pseudomonadota bacterium]